jgi:SAM-dependent methyltransferase
MEPRQRSECPYCRESSFERLQYADRRMTSCPRCGAWFTWPRPTADRINTRYAEQQAGMPARLREWRHDTVQSGWYDWLAGRISAAATRYGTNVSRIADVGAGALELSRSLSLRFPSARITAQDLFADAAMVNRISHASITLQQVDLNRLDLSSAAAAQFDVVACVAVIEHVLEPLALLRYLRSITAEGGFVYVAGPLADSWARRLMRSRWPYYSPDDHITIPTRNALRTAVALSGGGAIELHPIAVRYSSRYLLRFLRAPEFVARAFDVLIPIPSGAFELIWRHTG